MWIRTRGHMMCKLNAVRCSVEREIYGLIVDALNGNLCRFELREYKN